MRIISKFKDYYDSIQTFDKDDIVYCRDPNKMCAKKLLGQSIIDVHDDREREDIARLSIFCKMVLIGYRNMLLGFCGKLYPVVEVYYYEKNDGKISKEYKRSVFYKQEELDQFMTQMQKRKNPPKDAYYSIEKHIGSKYFKEREQRIETIRVKVLELFHSLNVPVFLLQTETYPGEFGGDGYRTGHYRRDVILETNPCLEEIFFQKIYDAYTVFQEIRMYLGGVLLRPETPMLTISDEVKAQQHGFNKLSFRALKGDKKPRQNNRGKKDK
ncbi:MAG: hypothetical protein HQK52_17880 [Oligoflexia bacterium]|nr:hypothetical protein [Oligoflexia bacterium]